MAGTVDDVVVIIIIIIIIIDAVKTCIIDWQKPTMSYEAELLTKLRPIH